MEIQIYPDKKTMSKVAAEKASALLRAAINQKGHATFMAATGASQFDFLAYLVADQSIDWQRTTMFHLDEYIGIPETHPASFRKYLKERLINPIGTIGTVNLINGDTADPQGECERLNKLLEQTVVDVAFVGIGENGHLAFNDPPADFEVEDPYIIVELDEACRKQQLGEGWFKSFDEVPTQAISASIKQIMKSANIICTVPDARKAEAVKNCLAGDLVSPLYPSSILKQHTNTFVYLDEAAASLLPRK